MNPIYLILLSLIGFSVSAYLYYTKTYDKKIYCIVGQDCDAVVKSKYGQTFGIENTRFGILYYIMVFVYAILLFLNRNIFKGSIIYYFVVSASIGSVLFSMYLVGVQALVLKKWCDYCIISTMVSLLILLTLIL